MVDLQPYFQLLQVSAKVTPDDLKAAFRRQALACHPDLHPENPNAEAEFQQLSEAYYQISQALYPSSTEDEFIHADGKGHLSEAQALYAQAAQKAAIRDYDGAIQDYTQAIAADPQFLDAYLKRCQLRFIQGDDEGVLADCTQILQLDSTVVQAYYYQGRARFQLGSAPAAIAAYSQAIALKETYAQAWLHRGRARLEMQETHLARQDLIQAEKLFDDQGEPNEVRRVQTMLQEMGRSPFLRPKVKTFRSHSLAQDIFTTIPQILRNPSGQLLPTFARLSAQRARAVGFSYAGLSLLGFLLAANLYPVLFEGVTLLERILLGTLPFFCLVGLNYLSRRLTRTRGSWASDIFISGATLLPLSLLMFVSGVVAPWGTVGVWIATVYWGCDAVLMMYVGCTQINNLSEQSATFAVPTLLLVTSALTYNILTIFAR